VRSQQVILTAGLHHLDRSDDRPPHRLLAEPDNGVREEVFRHGAHRRSIGGRVERKHRRHALPVERLDEDVEQLAWVTVVVARDPGQTIDEDPLRAHAGRFGQQQAVRFLNLLLKHPPRAGDDPESTLLLQLSEIPAERRDVADELLRRHSKGDDDPRLVELPRPTIDELQAERRLAGAG